MEADPRILFEPVAIGHLTAKNRIAMPAIHIGMGATRDGIEPVRAFYEERALGGAGVITVGVCNTWARADDKLSGALSLAADSDVEPMSTVAEAIRRGGAIAGVQISPLAGYNDPRWRPAPEEIGEMIASIGTAAGRAAEAGFDLVEIMVSGGSVLSHLVSPVHNTWEIPGYSGGWEERLRAPIEAAKAARRAAGGAILSARIHCHEFLERGYGTEGSIRVARALEGAGADVLNMTGGGHRTSLPQLTSHTPPGAFAHLARAVSDSVRVPTMFGGRLRTPEEATRVLIASGAAFANVGRGLIVDPEWPRKARDGDGRSIVQCMACGACFDQAFTKRPLACSLNPTAGRPLRRSETRESPMRILVAGGGPAGLEAAWALSRRGHRVSLFEMEDHLGGRWRKAATLRGRSDLEAPLRAFVERLEAEGVELITGRALTPDEAGALGPDAVVLATGARPRIPKLAGMDRHPSVLHSDEVLEDDRGVGARVAIVGAGGAGVELAIHLASEGLPDPAAIGFLARFSDPALLEETLAHRPSRTVTLLKRKGYAGKGIGRSVRWTMIAEMERLEVRVIDRARYEEITPEGIRIHNGRTGEDELVEADTIVLATGYEPDPDLAARFDGCAKRVVTIGDANEVADIGAAIEAGFELAEDL